MYNAATESGAAVFAGQLEKYLGNTGVNVYARNKEALVKTRAARGIGLEASINQHAVPSTEAASAMIALRGAPRDSAIVLYRDLVVNKLGEFGPGIRLSRSQNSTVQERTEQIIQTRAATARPCDAAAHMLTRVTSISPAIAHYPRPTAPVTLGYSGTWEIGWDRLCC